MADNNVNVGGEEIREDAILEATEQKSEEHNTDDQIIKVEDIEKAAEQAETPEAAAETEAPEAAANNVESEQDSEPDSEQKPEHNSKQNSKQDSDEVGFDELHLPEEIVRAVAKVGFETPSPIQAATIPTLMAGRDVVGLAQTGTGKTAAFALPILARIESNVRKPQALVLAPTRELALQVADSFQSFADHVGRISVLPIYGGQAYGVQLSGLRRGAQIIVGTPGRVIDHLERGSLDISELRFLVLDEADEMLQMGFQEDVERILSDTPDEKQVALFSATMPAAIRRLSKQYLTDPEEITVKSQTRTADNIRQRFLMVSHRNKLDALTRILEVEEFEAMIMFVRTKHETEELAEKLRARGFSAAAINGDIPQTLRERTIDQLKDGRLDILVATDVAARGLDVDRISHVVNFDIPHDTESYVHRIGRTGRAGRSGEALLFVTPREGRLLRSIERATKSSLQEMKLPTVDEVNDSRKQKFADSVTEALADPQVEVFRELIEEYAEEHDTPLVEIAAAIAAQAQNGEFLMKEPPRNRRDDRRGRDRDRDRFERERGRDSRDGRSRGERGQGRRAEAVKFDREGMSTYRINVGRRQHIRPGAIVGAIANEGGLSSKDFGHIDIRGDHTLVELPANLPQQVLDNLSDTRISGQLIGLRLDDGSSVDDSSDYRGGYGRGRGRGDRDRDRGGFRGGRGGRGGYRGDRERGERGDRGYGRDFRNDRNDRNDRSDRNDRGRGRGGRY